jgi:putative selenate reductase
LAQNIVAAFLGGGRFIELKTVQTMDGEELRKCVARPCINAADEGYNVEWSTELTVEEAFEEYVKAWFLVHLLGKEFGLERGCGKDAGVIFNMSVGYSLEGIKSSKINRFILGMKSARKTSIWESCLAYLAVNPSSFKRITREDIAAIPCEISSNITLSTLHGCPREEIEQIAHHLIATKTLHTYIKCNPTLLGYETARGILDQMGFRDLAFDDHHFKDDLQFDDAVEMLRRLKRTANKRGLTFGVKVTNTFPVDIKRGELPGSEMYMSGKALFPLSLTVAQKLNSAFEGTLPISYSGGADYFNLQSILATGIRPVTLATTMLKPGGYERLTQLAKIAEGAVVEGSAEINLAKLTALTESLPTLTRYQRVRRAFARKQDATLPLFDCGVSPCSSDGGCPIKQQIPAYLERVAAGDYDGAFAIIAKDNTAPSITGAICDHQCQQRCTRSDYDDPLQIRRAKATAAAKAEDAFTAALSQPVLKTPSSVGIVGAGPAGIAAAMYLRRNGVFVSVYEQKEHPYGIVRYVIPSFRIDSALIDRDYQMAVNLGVDFHFNVDSIYSVAELRKKHNFLILATGAWKAGAPPVTGTYTDALAFLEESKATKCRLSLGKTVAVIGGGDVAMDCARAAKRNTGVEKVTIVYRRTRDFMPAQDDEIALALEEGVELLELLAPETFKGGVLTCEVQELGGYDSTGRRVMHGTGKKKELPFDTVIGAVGARVDTSAFAKNGIALEGSGYAKVKESGETNIPGIYLAGDCKAGAATVVKAMADGKAVAADILAKLQLPVDFTAPLEEESLNAPSPLTSLSVDAAYAKKGVIALACPGAPDAERCLGCGDICEICVDVCPNRANMAVAVPGFAKAHQVVHIDRLCNECGNCATFCPQGGKPFAEKFTLFATAEDLEASRNFGVLPLTLGTYQIRRPSGNVVTGARKDLPEEYARVLDVLEWEHICI